MLNRLIKLLKEFEQSPEKLCPSVSDGGSCGKCEYNIDWGSCFNARRADYLLKHGVIASPCKVGDTVYIIYSDNGPIKEPLETRCIGYFVGELFCQLKLEPIKNGKDVMYSVDFTDIGEIAFFTKKEAKRKIKDKE